MWPSLVQQRCEGSWRYSLRWTCWTFLMVQSYQDSDVINHSIFDECEDVDIEKMPTFDVYPYDESFNLSFNSIFQCDNLEANTQGIIQHSDLYLYIDGDTTMHHFEDQFKEVLSYRCHNTFIQDLIMHWSRNIGLIGRAWQMDCVRTPFDDDNHHCRDLSQDLWKYQVVLLQDWRGILILGWILSNWGDWCKLVFLSSTSWALHVQGTCSVQT